MSVRKIRIWASRFSFRCCHHSVIDTAVTGPTRMAIIEMTSLTSITFISFRPNQRDNSGELLSHPPVSPHFLFPSEVQPLGQVGLLFLSRLLDKSLLLPLAQVGLQCSTHSNGPNAAYL